MTEILYAIGAGDDVAAVTKFCDWPPLAKNKPKVGSLINTEPEKINELKDLVLLKGYTLSGAKKFLRSGKKAGARAAQAATATKSELLEEIRKDLSRLIKEL